MSDAENPPSIPTEQLLGGVHDVLDISVVEFSKDRVVLSLPVGPKVHQPFGLLHGGVSALLAESAASMGGSLNVEAGQGIVGIEINASHLRGIAEGTLIATATPVRIGRTVHVWRIELTDESGRGICDARCTLAVIQAPTS
jgi:uncharacterized protein (TIGR00369 family)